MKSLFDRLAAGALPRESLLGVTRIVLLYAAFAATWILLSDSVVGWLFHSPGNLALANTLKGLLFVTVTSLLLFFLLLRFAAGRGAVAKVGADGTAASPSRRGLIISIVLFSVIFALLGAGGMLHVWRQQRHSEGAMLQSIARLKVAQLESWLAGRRRDAEVARTAFLFQELLPGWRKSGDPAVRQRLLTRLENFSTLQGHQSVALCDERGDILLQAGDEGHGSTPPLRAALAEALASGDIRMTDLYAVSVPPPDHVHLDFVAPIPPAAGESAFHAALVMRAAVNETVYAFLQDWPTPSATGETLLVRREGDAVVFLNDLRYQQDAALKLRSPLGESRLLAAQALSSGYVPGGILSGVDYRGHDVLGVAWPVAGTSWWLIAKIDTAEAFEAARHGVLLIALASLLTWLVAVTLALLTFQRHELLHARRHGREQTEKLHVLRLLEAVAASSRDIIFAKDEAGRFTLFNRAAEKFAGKSAVDVLGRDETALFPPEIAARLIADDRRVMEAGSVHVFEDHIPTPRGEEIFLTTKGPLLDTDGRTIGMYGIAHDISERARMEEHLRQSNAELERFNQAMIGRELDMVELKRRINALSIELGREAPFDLARLDALDERTGGGRR